MTVIFFSLLSWEVTIDPLFFPVSVVFSNSKDNCAMGYSGLHQIEETFLQTLIVVIYTKTTAETSNRHFKGLQLDKGLIYIHLAYAVQILFGLRRLLSSSLNAVFSTDSFAVLLFPKTEPLDITLLNKQTRLKVGQNFKTVAIQRDVSRMAEFT